MYPPTLKVSVPISDPYNITENFILGGNFAIAGGSSNGRTPPFEGENRGSNPCPPDNNPIQQRNPGIRTGKRVNPDLIGINTGLVPGTGLRALDPRNLSRWNHPGNAGWFI